MDWSRIKTIFIIVFLILDLFLLFWLREKQDSENIPILNETSFEEQLKADEIVVENLPTDVREKHFLINATSKEFTEEELDLLTNQQVVLKEGIIITSTLEAPTPLDFEVTSDNMKPILEETVLYGDQYRLWQYNEENRTIVYYQTYKEFTLYNNQSGRITFYLNENNEIFSYTQTMFESFEEYSEQKILEPMSALEILHSNKKIEQGSVVNEIELGYYTLVQQSLQGEVLTSQVLAPTWYFQVNEEETLFVNALEGEGQIIEMNDLNTITE